MKVKILNWFLFVLPVFVIYILSYLVLLKVGVLTEVPNNTKLLTWDASWYASIVNNGYFLDLENQSNAGFFPGFPYLWKLLNATPLVIALVNCTLFLSGLYLLKFITNASFLKSALIFSLPSIFFFYLPYSESLFYFFSVLFIISWQKKKMLFMLLFAVLLSFVRPVFFFLIPAIVGLFILLKNYKSYFSKSVLTIVSLLLGAFAGFVLIGVEVGDVFAYSKSQVNQWGHELKIPSYPLTTWRGYRILWLDGLALFVTIIAFLFLLLELVKVRFLSFKSNFSQIEVIAFGYLFMILIYVLFFHPVEEGRTTILSLNRYVFCNPFLHFVLLKRMHEIKLSWKSFFIPILASFIVLLMIGFPFYSIVELNYTSSLVFSVGLFVFFIVASLSFYDFKYNKIVCALFIAASFFVQLYLFNSFLKGNWIG